MNDAITLPVVPVATRSLYDIQTDAQRIKDMLYERDNTTNDLIRTMQVVCEAIEKITIRLERLEAAQRVLAERLDVVDEFSRLEGEFA